MHAWQRQPLKQRVEVYFLSTVSATILFMFTRRQRQLIVAARVNIVLKEMMTIQPNVTNNTAARTGIYRLVPDKHPKSDECCLSSYPDILTANEARKVLRIGTNTFYDLVKSGELKALFIGGKYLIPKQSLEIYISSCYNTGIDGSLTTCAKKGRC